MELKTKFILLCIDINHNLLLQKSVSKDIKKAAELYIRFQFRLDQDTCCSDDSSLLDKRKFTSHFCSQVNYLWGSELESISNDTHLQLKIARQIEKDTRTNVIPSPECFIRQGHPFKDDTGPKPEQDWYKLRLESIQERIKYLQKLIQNESWLYTLHIDRVYIIGSPNSAWFLKNWDDFQKYVWQRKGLITTAVLRCSNYEYYDMKRSINCPDLVVFKIPCGCRLL